MALLESLESRVLFTATAGQVAAGIHSMKGDEGKLRVAISGLGKQLTKGQKLTTGDLAKLGVSSSQASLVAALASADSGLTNVLSGNVSTYSPELNSQLAMLSSLEKQLRKDPTNSDLKNTIDVEGTGLTSISINGNEPFMANYKNPPAVFAALDAITAANTSSSKVAKDVKAIEKSVASAMSKTYFAAVKLFDNDISNFLYLLR